MFSCFSFKYSYIFLSFLIVEKLYHLGRLRVNVIGVMDGSEWREEDLMRNKLKAYLIAIIIILALFIAGKFALDAIFGDMCGNDIKQKIHSPNGENIAYLFERNCGATTGLSRQLSILNKDEKFQNESGNTFRSDKEFSIEWLNDKNLKVIYDKSSETYKMDKEVNGVKILYVDKKAMEK